MKKQSNLKLSLYTMLLCASMGALFGAIEREPHKIARNLVYEGFELNTRYNDGPGGLKRLNKAENLDPSYAWIYLCRADILAEHGAFNEALEEYDRAIALGVGTEVEKKAIATRKLSASAEFRKIVLSSNRHPFQLLKYLGANGRMQYELVEPGTHRSMMDL